MNVGRSWTMRGRTMDTLEAKVMDMRPMHIHRYSTDSSLEELYTELMRLADEYSVASPIERTFLNQGALELTDTIGRLETIEDIPEYDMDMERIALGITEEEVDDWNI